MGLKSLMAGAAAMYFFDPDHGRRRRSLTRDKFVRLYHQMERETEIMIEDLRNRVAGARAEFRSHLHPEDVTDERLQQRIRSELGHVTSHSRAIQVEAQNGRVVVSGPVLSSEAEQIIRRIEMTAGVTHVEDRLERHDQPGDHPGLQGGHAIRADHQLLTTPASRLVIGTIGSAMFVRGMLTGQPLRTLLGLAGLGFCMADTMQPELRRTAEQISSAFSEGQQGSGTSGQQPTGGQHNGPRSPERSTTSF